MGVYLSKPNEKKETAAGENNTLRYGFAAMQGWRMSMEDAHICTLNLTEDISLFAVFDGHGGDEVAKFCEKNFGEQLKKSQLFQAGQYKAALEETFLKMDYMLGAPGSPDMPAAPRQELDSGSTAGCTANVVLITPTQIFVANAGDSRCYLHTLDGQTIPLSEDHKPDNDSERDRITKAGGYVSCGRVCDNLNLSRAIGDMSYKKNVSLKPHDQIITAFPDVVVRGVDKNCGYLLIGCDGIWETLTPAEICKIANNRIKKSPNADLVEVCKELLDRLIAKDTSEGTGCDNMSLIVVQFKN